MNFLITRPDYDPPTKYLSCWSEMLIELATQKGMTVLDLQGKKANKRELVGRLSKLNPPFIVLNGHGSEDSITGQDEEILIQAGDNEDVLHSRITYAVSCSCAKVLGPQSILNGDSTFIGYKDDFVFTMDRRYLSRPLDDTRARPFMEASNQVPISLLKGNKAAEASKRSKETFERNYKKLLSSNSDPNSLQDARFLWWNMKNQVCLGNEGAAI